MNSHAKRCRWLLLILVSSLPIAAGCGSADSAEKDKTREQQLEEDKSRQSREMEEVRGK